MANTIAHSGGTLCGFIWTIYAQAPVRTQAPVGAAAAIGKIKEAKRISSFVFFNIRRGKH